MNKDDFFALNQCKVQEVKLPESDKVMHVKSLNGEERAKLMKLQAALDKQGDNILFDTWVVIFSACDQAGNRMFADADFDKLQKMPAATITHIAWQSLVVNGLSPDAVDEAKKN